MGFVIFIHVVVCVLLSVAILMQSGRGGGLTESFASAESIFGARTNVFMVKATTILGSIFLVTCLTLAYLSTKQQQSLMSGRQVRDIPVKSSPVPAAPAAAPSTSDNPVTQPSLPVQSGDAPKVQ